MSQQAGTRLGPYEILAPLGAGGMGEVYRARDTRLDRVVALKVLPGDAAQDPTARARFDREARAIAALSHPNICALFDVGHDQGHPFLVMELLEGQTLQQRLLGGPFDLQQFVDVGQALADALDAAHSQGLVHRDLKPANIFLTSRGVPKILDFGLAKALAKPEPIDDETQPADLTLTGRGTTVGTVAYMSPEQLRGESVDARTDLFSLGLVLYEMATGQRAFPGATSAVVSAGILTRQPVSPRSVRPDLPERLEDTILKAIEKDRDMRCQSAAELRADLMRLRRESAGSQPIALASAAPSGTAPDGASGAPVASSATLRRPVLWTVGAVVLVGAALAAVYWQGSRRTTVPAGPAAAETVPLTPVAPSEPAPTPSATAAAEVAPPTADSPEAAAPVEPVGQASQPPAGPAASPPSTEAVPEPPAVAREGAGGRSGTSRGRNGRGAFGPAVTTLIGTLRTLPPQTFHIVYAAETPRSLELARQLNTILIAAGWRSSGILPGEDLPPMFGIGVPRRSRPAAALNNWAIRSEFVTGYPVDYRVLPNLTEIHLVVGPVAQ